MGFPHHQGKKYIRYVKITRYPDFCYPRVTYAFYLMKWRHQVVRIFSYCNLFVNEFYRNLKSMQKFHVANPEITVTLTSYLSDIMIVISLQYLELEYFKFIRKCEGRRYTSIVNLLRTFMYMFAGISSILQELQNQICGNTFPRLL